MPEKDKSIQEGPSVYRAECKNGHPPVWIITNNPPCLTVCDICNKPCTIYKDVSVNLLGKYFEQRE